MHLLSRCSALGPGPGSLPRLSSSPSSRTWPCALFAPYLVPCGTAWHSGAPGVLRRGVGAPLGGLIYLFIFRRDQTKIFEGNAITFLIPRTTPRGFFAILTTPRRILFSTLEGLLRPGALWRQSGLPRSFRRALAHHHHPRTSTRSHQPLGWRMARLRTKKRQALFG
jgi:hypothetical protein